MGGWIRCGVLPLVIQRVSGFRALLGYPVGLMTCNPLLSVSTNPNFVVNLPAAAGGSSGGALGLTFENFDSTFNLNVRLSALENRGSVKIVSSPKITTLDNKVAKISRERQHSDFSGIGNGVQTIVFDAVLLLQVQLMSLKMAIFI